MAGTAPDTTATTMTTAFGEATVVRVTGDLDAAVVGVLRVRLLDAVAGRPPALVLDLTGVEFCAAAVLHVLLDVTACARSAGVPCAIVADCRAVLKPIAVTGLFPRLWPLPNLAAAREWLAGPDVLRIPAQSRPDEFRATGQPALGRPQWTVGDRKK
ncbi:STAS domain-containing protein [Actinosynnema sp. NPDC050436]|uniref:STAS domain-containing protein n=1 Tax=Actinosynnema sp. NPDC050436 TaxID=3155659 RepID=UPI0033C33A18